MKSVELYPGSNKLYLKCPLNFLKSFFRANMGPSPCASTGWPHKHDLLGLYRQVTHIMSKGLSLLLCVAVLLNLNIVRSRIFGHSCIFIIGAAIKHKGTVHTFLINQYYMVVM